MPYQFTAEEISRIQAARAQCPIGDNVATSTGSWEPFYTALSEVIGNRITSGAVTGSDLQDLNNAKLWLDVAIGANANVGMHSAFIRGFTNRQGELRLGRRFAEPEMQFASNSVALSLWNDLNRPTDGRPPWSVPAIRDIARFDASAIGISLFAPSLGPVDSASRFNSAWSGTIGFNLLGGSPPYESWRLIASGDTGSELAATANTLDDFKNLLFMVDSYAKGLSAGFAATGESLLIYLANSLARGQSGGVIDPANDPILAQLRINAASDNWWPCVNLIASRTPAIAPSISLITAVGPPRFLDMLRGAFAGRSFIGGTTDANFTARAREFFDQLSVAQVQSTRTLLLPTSRTDLEQLALSDVAVRAALAGLSIVAIDPPAEVAARLSLYDPATGNGEVTREWLSDRAAMTVRVASPGWSNTAVITGQGNTRYFDVASGAQVLLGAVDNNNLRSQIGFGGANNDTLTGFGFADHLYGGDGNDIVNGQGGADHLEGNAGNDNLDGGAGNDILLGGTGNDTLDGGAGADLLQGGQGADRYVFSGQWSHDTIVDPQGDGEIWIGTLGLHTLALTRSGANTWHSADRQITVTRSVASGPGDLVIQVVGSTDAGTITVRNWSDGQLGIQLGGEVSAPPTGNTLVGDFAKDLQPDGVSYVLGPTGYVADGPQINAPDVLNGTAAAELLQGLGGNDGISGGAGDDIIEGGDGDDLLLGGDGADVIRGGAGVDYIYGSATARINRPDRADFVPPSPSGALLVRGFSWIVEDPPGDGPYMVVGVTSSPMSGETTGNVIEGGTGNDRISAGSGADLVNAGADDDVVWGMGGADVLFGDDGADVLMGDGTGQLNLFQYTAPANAGNDVLVGGAGNDTLRGQGFDDQLYGGADDDLIFGDDTESADTPTSTHGADFLDGGDGADRLFGGGGNDTLEGGTGADSLVGDDVVSVVQGALHGADRLDGGAGNDSLFGLGGDDILSGGDDQDDLDGDAATADLAGEFHGRDHLDGGRGDDTLRGGGSGDTLYGGQGHDAISGDAPVAEIEATFHGDDWVDGGAGNDTIWGDGGHDVLYGGDGNDFLAGEHQLGLGQSTSLTGNDWLDGGAGQDILIGGQGQDTLQGGSGDDTLEGGSGEDTFVFNTGDGVDLLFDDGSGGTVQFADAGSTGVRALVGDMGGSALGQGSPQLIIEYGAGDRILIDNGFAAGPNRFEFADGSSMTRADLIRGITASIVAVGGAGNDAIDGGAGADQLEGGEGNDLLQGGAGNDLLIGGAGDDTLNAGAGGGTLRGGDGSDIYLFSRGDGLVQVDNVELNTFGFDRVQMGPGIGSGEVIVQRRGDDLALVLDGGASVLTVAGHFNPWDTRSRLDAVWFADGTGWSRLDLEARAVATPTAGNDYLTGTTGADEIRAGAGADTVLGLDGDDQLFGDAGRDNLIGGTGNDRIEGGADVDTASGGDGDGLLVDGNFEDSLTGDAGNDTLRGGAVMDGGAGSDRYILESWPSQWAGANWGAVGTIQIIETVTAASDLDELVLPTGMPTQDLTFSRSFNASTGGDDDLSIGSLAGGGRILLPRYFADDPSRSGVEVIRLPDGTALTRADIDRRVGIGNGGEGNDSLKGLRFNDLIDAGAGDDVVSGQLGDDTLLGGAGQDQLMGDGGADVLDGGSGIDLLRGGVGADRYLWGTSSGRDLIEESGSATREVDTVALGPGIAPADVTLRRDGNALVIVVGNGPLQLRSNAQFITQGWSGQFLDHAIERIEFASGEVWDAAAIAARTVVGVANTMTGTSGNDTFTVDDAGDVIVEAAGGGADTVNASVSYRLGSNVENGTITGVLNASLIGNDQNNLLMGNSGANTFNGGLFTPWQRSPDWSGWSAGADTMVGGAGDDLYWVNGVNGTNSSAVANDAVVEAAGEGIDTVISNVENYTLPDHVENLVDLYSSWSYPTTARTLTGNALGNLIDVQASPQLVRIDGGGGADTMMGAASGVRPAENIFVVDHAGDQIVLRSANSIDTVESSIAYTLGAGVEQLWLTGTQAIAGTGNSAANVLDGRRNGAANALAGGAGDDTYLIAAGDTVVETPGQGVDTVVITRTGPLGSVVSLSSFANVENLTVGGSWTLVSGDYASGGTTIEGNDSANLLRYLSWGAPVGSTGVHFNIGGVLLGGGGNDTLEGASGDDTLDGGTGADVMAGGSGSDLYRVDHVGDVVSDIGTSGTDTIEAAVDFALVSTGIESLVAVGSQGLRLTGDANDNTLDGSRAAWSDTLVGGGGNDRYVVGAGDVVVEDANAGDDIMTSSVSFVLAANVETGQLLGSGTAEVTGTTSGENLIGNAGNNVLRGLAGNDTLTATGGTDRLEGGSGSDTYIVTESTARSAGSATVIDQEAPMGGSDTLRIDTFWSSFSSTWAARLSGDDLRLDYIGAGASGPFSLLVQGALAAGGTTVGPVQFLDATVTLADVIARAPATATAGPDLINGTPANDTLVGLAGNDTINGGAGNDRLDGGSGADRLAGGTGDDVYVVDDVADTVIEVTGEGTDMVESSVTWSLPTHVEHLVLIGSAAINGTGNASANRITGNATANLLDGAAGADTLLGGAGDDTYIVDASADVVTENAGEGLDTIRSTVTWTLGSNLENLTLTGTAAINGTGNTLANIVTGNSAANRLTGGAGDDTLDGAAGNDTLVGGTGNDTYAVDSSSDVTTENAGEGTDTVRATVTWTLGNNLENLVLLGTANLNGTGNGLFNGLTGNAGNNTLNGGVGNDTMAGGAGNDTYVVDATGDVVNEAANEGTDLVQSAVSWTLGANVENLTLTGTSATNGIGNGLANVITGNSANNRLEGGAGHDTLVGGGGVDTLVGGIGDDSYTVDSTTDVVTELINEGIDLVQSNVTWTLGSNLENLTLTGTVAINGTGNTLDNVLVGNAANNVLQGLAGNDIYDGGAGADTLTDNSTTSNDIYRWGLGRGNDTISDAGGADRIELAAGVTASQVSLTRSGNHLQVRIAGSTDVLTVSNWYVSVANQIETIRLADGSVIEGRSAPLALSTASASTRLSRQDSSAIATPAADSGANLERRTHLLIEAMAQFAPQDAAAAAWMPQSRVEPFPYLTMPS
jgi:trimeric autotransporter adhesin